MATLRELTEEYKSIFYDEELDFESWKGMLELIKDDIEKKCNNYLIIFDEYKAQEEKFRKESVRTAEIADGYKKKCEWLKRNIYETMNELGIKEVKNDFYKIKIQANGGVAPLIIKEGVKIPEEYQKVHYDLDNDKIREALKTQTLEFAELGERGTHLVIK